MTPFSYRRAGSFAEAASAMAGSDHRLLGGGTNLIDLMRKGIEHPSALLDVSSLPGTIEAAQGGGVVIGAATRNSAVATHPIIRRDYPMLARAILAGASVQVRNMATVGGNLMQRTRCLYFQDVSGAACNKRKPGSGCDALGGFNRYHAILGASPACIATHPSDMCVALAALDAVVHVAASDRTRTIAFADFHRLPGDRPDLETALAPGEVIVAIELPPPFGGPSTYRKVRDRASYAFALVSVAAGLTMVDGRVDAIRIAFGGVAARPWRAMQAEAALIGGPATVAAFEAAAAEELAEADPPAGAAFKVELTKRLLVTVLAELSGAES